MVAVVVRTWLTSTCPCFRACRMTRLTTHRWLRSLISAANGSKAQTTRLGGSGIQLVIVDDGLTPTCSFISCQNTSNCQICLLVIFMMPNKFLTIKYFVRRWPELVQTTCILNDVLVVELYSRITMHALFDGGHTRNDEDTHDHLYAGPC